MSTSDQARALLLDTASRLFAEGAEETLQEQVESGEWPGAFWDAIEDNGLPWALVPVEAGGIGLELADAIAVLRLAGAFATPAPLLETMVGRWLLASADLEIPDEPLTIAAGPDAGPIDGEISAKTLRLKGTARHLPWARPDALVALVAQTEDGPVAVTCRLEPARLTASRNLAGEPLGRFEADGLVIEAGGWSPLQRSGDARRLEVLAALGRAAQMAGALERILDLTVEHAREREQFGRPIGRFQAVQNQIAVLAAESAATGGAVEFATDSVAREQPGTSSWLAVGAAKARAGQATRTAAPIAHQVHAAIGFTREHVLHRFTRRLWSWRDDYGSESWWWEAVGALAIEAGPDGVWPLIAGA